MGQAKTQITALQGSVRHDMVTEVAKDALVSFYGSATLSLSAAGEEEGTSIGSQIAAVSDVNKRTSEGLACRRKRYLQRVIFLLSSRLKLPVAWRCGKLFIWQNDCVMW